MVCLSKYLSSELPEILLTNSQADAYSRHTMFQVASRKRSDQRKAQPGSGVNNSSDEKNNRLTRPDSHLEGGCSTKKHGMSFNIFELRVTRNTIYKQSGWCLFETYHVSGRQSQAFRSTK